MSKNKITVGTDQKSVTVDGKEQKFESKSKLFTYLYDKHEMTVGDIARLVGVRYQFVYQIITNHTGGEIRSARAQGPTKSQKFRELFDSGMTVAQIARETNSNNAFVHSVIKKYKEEQAKSKETPKQDKKAASK